MFKKLDFVFFLYAAFLYLAKITEISMLFDVRKLQVTKRTELMF